MCCVYFQTNLQTAAQHADLLRKVENLNLLQDSNRLLREDKERTVLLLRQMEARVIYFFVNYFVYAIIKMGIFKCPIL